MSDKSIDENTLVIQKEKNQIFIPAVQGAIKFRQFPLLYQRFLCLNPTTEAVEEAGAELVQKVKSGKKPLWNVQFFCFVLSVLKWGGQTGNRIRGQITKGKNETEVQKELAQAIRSTIDCMEEGSAKALAVITEIKGLGGSYGTKILRMLAPDKAVTYDAELNKIFKFGENFHKSGKGRGKYEKFCADCAAVANALNECEVGSRRWIAANVEAVIFHWWRT